MEGPGNVPPDCDDVQEQIEQQRKLTAQLKEKLESDEFQLASKKQQNELCEAKLSLLKSRQKTKQNVTTKKDENKEKGNSTSDSPKYSALKLSSRKQVANSSSKGKINILREQLEQNRLRFEQHGIELSEDTRSMEAMVEQLRHELEERDATIEQLQVGQLLPEKFESEEVVQPVDIRTQLLQKEEEVKDLLQQNSNLQNIILELQENVKEKDCVIEARTQAISLLSEDMSKKWRTNVDMLEETRQQMKMMQENFVRIEAGLNSEIEQLNLQLQHNSKKLSETEQNLRAAEASHHNIVLKNSELLLELESLRAAPGTSTEMEEAKMKIEELSSALSEANKLVIKLKAEHKAKIKTLNKQIDNLRKDLDSGSELVRLQNHVAELEEEKGNLQLHLIEVEENTASQEQKIKQQQETISQLENQNIISEKKLVVLEEQLASSRNMEQDITELKAKLKDRENEIQILTESLKKSEQYVQSDFNLRKELAETKSSLQEWQCRYETIEKQLNQKATTDMQFEDKTNYELQSEKQLAKANSEENLMHKVQLLEQSIHEKHVLVEELENLVQSNLIKIDDFAASGKCLNCESLMHQLAEKEELISALEHSVGRLKEENETHNLQLQQAAVDHEKSLLNSSIDTPNLQQQLIEVSGELELRREECIRLENKLKAQLEKSKKIAVNLKVKTIANKELEERVAKYETVVQSSKAEIDQLSSEKNVLLEKWKTEVEEKNIALNQAAEHLSKRDSELSILAQQLDIKLLAIDELHGKIADLKAHNDKLMTDLEEKTALVKELESAILEKSDLSEKLATLQSAIDSVQSQLDLEKEEKQAAILKLENFTKQAKLKIAKEKKLRSEIINRQGELETLLAEKSSALTAIQQQHAQEIESFHQEKEKLETLLKQEQEKLAYLSGQLDHERSKFQTNSDSMPAGEPDDVTQEYFPVPSLEGFLDEIEDLCASQKTPQDALPILEEEKAKMMNELSNSFEDLHNQILIRLQNRPDLNADRKLFAELRNLVVRVIHRTAALEIKIKKIVADSNQIIQKNLLDAQESIKTLESQLSEATNILENKEKEKLDLENTINNLEHDRLRLDERLHNENMKCSEMELKLNETNNQMNSFMQTINSQQEQISEKEYLLRDLEGRYESVSAIKDQIQQDVNSLHQQNVDVQSKFQKLWDECEMLKTELARSEQQLSDSNQNISQLKLSCDDVYEKYEGMRRKADESTEQLKDIQSQLEKSVQERTELRKQLSDAINISTQLQDELSMKSHLLVQQNDAWTLQREQLQQQIYDLSQQLQTALEQTHKKTVHHISSPDEIAVRQQLAEKTAEVENYQKRLLQLQMEVSIPSEPSLMGTNIQITPLVNDFQSEESFVHQVASSLGGDSVESNPTFDSTSATFRPAGDTSELYNLREKVRILTEQVNLLLLQKSSLESEKEDLEVNFAKISKELNAAKEELDIAKPALMACNKTISELKDSLVDSETELKSERLISKKLQENIKELQKKFENEEYEKEKAECELKIKAQKEADERPSIPHSLDTHVSTLQDSGSGFSENEKLKTFDLEKNDECLMESNMCQLESELRGMVMSQLDTSVNQSNNVNSKKEKVMSVENSDSEGSDLRKKVAQLEEEKNAALSQIELLQSEIKSLSQASKGPSKQEDSQSVFMVTETLMNEDDNWEWGASNDHLEMQDQNERDQGHSVPESLDELQSKINLLKDEKEAMEREKNQLVEDLKASQIRCAKLTRKFRDLKAKFDEFNDRSRSADSPLDSLDQAIEEERVKQVQGLEKHLNDARIELSALKAERDRLQKQVDVFSSANERMMEAKERQDVEVELWQKRCKDLTNQVQALEWRIKEMEEGTDRKLVNSPEDTNAPELLVKSSQTSETLKPIEIDQLLKENHTWNANYENLMQEYQKLRAQCLAETEQRIQVDALVSQQKGIIERLENEKKYFEDVYDSLKIDYEFACAQLPAKQGSHTESVEFHKQSGEELTLKLLSAEKQLQEHIMQLQVVNQENLELQNRCSILSAERVELLEQLEQSRIQLETSGLETKRLQESISAFERKPSHEVQPSAGSVPAHDVFAPQESLCNSSVLNWTDLVSEGQQVSTDVFESIACSTTVGLEEKLTQKDNELQREKRMIETLKRTMEESEQEWNQLIEHHKSQLQAAKSTISHLQGELDSLKQERINDLSESSDTTLDLHNAIGKCQEQQNIIFLKEKELESLQISLAVCEESKSKLQDELGKKNAEVKRLLEDSALRGEKALLAVEVPLTTSEQISAATTSPSHSSAISSPEKNINISALSISQRNLSSELDQALYMLHERDVRCEELTLELTQLLEERDGLQLRLSNAIRTNEELRDQLNKLCSSQSVAPSINFNASMSGQDNLASAKSFENLSAGDHAADLQNKLAELRKIGYSHDKRFRDDSEYRHQQQMRLMSSSPTNVTPANPDEVADAGEAGIVPTSEPAEGSPQSESSDVGQSSSESLGSLLGWFWGRN